MSSMFFVDPKLGMQAYFSCDDGKTWFADDINKLPPFDKDGRVAYRVNVYTCDGGKTKFVSHLERYTPEAKRALEQMRADRAEPRPYAFTDLMVTGLEVKKPGMSEWVEYMDSAAAAVMDLCSPDGSTENIEPVVP